MYRLGWPGAQMLGRLGVPLLVKVDIHFDNEAHVFVGVSDDLRGLVVEAESLDEMAREVAELVPALLAERSRTASRRVVSSLSYTQPAAASA